MAKIDVLGQFYASYKDLKRQKTEEFRVELARIMQSNLESLEDMMLACVKEGATKAEVGRRMGTTNRNRINEMIANAERRLGVTGVEWSRAVGAFTQRPNGAVEVKWEGYESSMEFDFMHPTEGRTYETGFTADLAMTVERVDKAWKVADFGDTVVRLHDGTVPSKWQSKGLVEGDLSETNAFPGASLGRELTKWSENNEN